MNKLIILLGILLLVIPFVSATTDEIRFIGQQDVNLNITEQCFYNGTYCSATAKCNIIILDPSQNLLINNQQMSNLVYIHTYDFSLTNTTGVYESNVMCKDTTQNGFDTFYFKITYNGKEEPSGFTQIIFIIFFVIIFAVTLVSIIFLVKHLEQMDFDMWDLLIMFGIYFSNFSLKYFNMQYMGSYIIDTFSDMFIDIGSITHIVLPVIIFILCFFRRRLELKEEDV